MKKYRMLSTSSEGLYRERGSKFIAYAEPAISIEECEQILVKLRKDHPKARHFCFAYRLGEEGDLYRSSDDGEPSGTAGRPILARIDSYKLTYTIVVVVRYFGGKLLGAAGLLRAYRDATEDALAKAQIIVKLITRRYQLCSPYPLVGRVEESLGRHGISVLGREFGAQAIFSIELPHGEEERLINSVLAYTLELPNEQVGTESALAGVSIKPYSDADGLNFSDNEFMQ